MTYSEKLIDFEKTAQALGIRTKRNEPMSAHTTFRVGGCCDIMAFPNSVESVRGLIMCANASVLNYYVLGNGSNVLLSDKGFRGAIILLSADFSEITVKDDVITAAAGASLQRVCRLALESGLSGMEFAYGIPGTVGGAVYMNAGAYGGEIKDIVSRVTCVNRQGEIITYKADELDLSYRSSRFSTSGEIILSADFKLEKGDSSSIKARMDELMERRKSRQPLEYPSAGSAFKRPEGTFAGLVIEQSGLKGYTVGGAQISEKHANFIINRGGATADDIMTLISEVKKTVKEKTGYELECEIRIIDD